MEVFTCETFTKLTLGSCFVIDFLPGDTFLPALKTLCLCAIRFHEFRGCCAFNMLLSASPKLEELVMENVEFECWKWSFTVSSPTLRRLTIRREEWDHPGLDYRGLAYEFDTLSFDTPGLTYLEYDDYVPKHYPFVNLDSLVEAKLDLLTCVRSEWEEIHTKDFNPMNLINALENVAILDLSIYTMKMIYVFRKAIPVFVNLFHLSIRFAYNTWLSLPILLMKSPNLKTLIIKGSLYDISNQERGISVSQYTLSSSVEVLKITYYRGTNKELEQMKQLLEKLSCLKLVEVCCSTKGEEKVRVLTDLLMLPRASTKCKIQVTFS